MATTYLLLGTNMGCRSDYLKKAQNLLAEKVGLISKISSIYETEAWGKAQQNDYLNQVLSVETHLPPLSLLKATSDIENRLGRERKETWGPRTIDIDILFYDQQIYTSDQLVIPHPHIPKRRFTLIPLAEIASNFIHPIFQKSIQQLLMECQDTLQVEKYALTSSH